MEKFGEVPRKSWEGEGDIAAEAIGEEAMKKAEELLGDVDFTIAPDTEVVKPIQDRRPEDPMALTPDKVKTAKEILEGNAADNIYYVQERPDKLTLTDAPTKNPIAKATVDAPPRPQTATDTRFDHVGKNFTAPLPTRPASQPAAKPKGFFQKLFGG